MQNVLLELTRIVRAVALLDSPQDQVRAIVDSISQALGQEVCSLYRIDENGSAKLLASHGLTSMNDITIPNGMGLVGAVVRARHPVNLADAASHPDFYNLETSNEHKFKNFCGAPLVNSGSVIGVLVVQSKKAVKLDQDGEAFLVTLASQLAIIVAQIPLSEENVGATNICVQGTIGAPGIAVGSSLLSAGENIGNVPDARCDNIEVELALLADLLLAARQSINEEKAMLGDSTPESVRHIFDSYSLLLADRTFIEKIEAEIAQGHWLPSAIKISVSHFSEVFKAMADPYLRSRHEDMEHLGNKLLEVWSGNSGSQSHLYDKMESIVLVGSQLSVSDIAKIPHSKLAAIVCYDGSTLSHSSVLARALGIPALMGVQEMRQFHSGDSVIVDCDSGQLILNPDEGLLVEYRQLIQRNESHKNLLDVLRDKAAITLDGEKISLMVNTGLLADITPGIKSGAEGVGLYRSEIPFMVHSSFPSEDEQITSYLEVFNAYKDKPVYMRTLDIGGDKQLSYFPIQHEENPALGWRGIRLTLDVIQLLVTQVRAMLRAAGTTGKLHIILPMVSSLHEIQKFNSLLDDVCKELTSEGHSYRKPKIGIMVEVPAAISQIDNFSQHIDFIAIGSNDLGQYLLAIDRNNAKVAKGYDYVHPAMLRELSRIVASASKNRLPVSLCGEMASDLAGVYLLLGMGIRQLSLSAARLPEVKSMILKLRMSHARTLVKRALEMVDAAEIRNLMDSELRLLDEIPSEPMHVEERSG